jgi:hypothetical protein
MTSGTPYALIYTRQFRRDVKSEKLTAPEIAKLEEFCAAIGESPYDAKGKHALKHTWAGFEAADFDGRRNIIFRICEECIKMNHQELHPLKCCEMVTDAVARTITFVNFGNYHKSAGRRRLEPSAKYDSDDN